MVSIIFATMRNVIVKVQGDANGITQDAYLKSIPVNSEILGLSSFQLPDGFSKSLLAIKANGRTYYIDESMGSYTDLLDACCAGGTGTGSGAGSGGGVFTATINTEGSTFQDDRLIGSSVEAFLLDGTGYQSDPDAPSSFAFDSASGTITLDNPPFVSGSKITVFYGKLTSIVLTGVAGTIITSSLLVGRTVNGYFIDNTGGNLGYSKPTNSNTLTFTDGTILNGGEKITLILD